MPEYVKALLVFKGVPFPKSHSIDALLALLPRALRPELDAIEQDRLTEYATVTRYPGDYGPIPLKEARKAVAIARRARRDLRRCMPLSVLRRKRVPRKA
ncbi:MAG: HEPN domain-containing protein [Kiritimatiellae bacterium]|nr:HEPN domain-containing protein [Kiritimatiellia bacterium]